MDASLQGASGVSGFQLKVSDQTDIDNGEPKAEGACKVVGSGTQQTSIGDSAVNRAITGRSVQPPTGAVQALSLSASETAAKIERFSLPEVLELDNYFDQEVALSLLLQVTKGCRLGRGTWGGVYKYKHPGGESLVTKINSPENRFHSYLQVNPNKYDVAALSLPEHPHLMKNHAVLVASKQDARHCGVISHPDQIPDNVKGALYIAAVVSEFVEGPTLNALITTCQVDQDNLIKIAAQLSGALAHMHENGFAHRDISTLNIIYDPVHGVKLIDMGAAIKTLKRSGSYIGANQLLEVDGYDPQSINKYLQTDYEAKSLDSWELGCTLFFCLTGKHVNYYQPFVDAFCSETSNPEYVAYFAQKTDDRKKQIIIKNLKIDLQGQRIHPGFLDIVVELLREKPADRPTAKEVEKRLASLHPKS